MAETLTACVIATDEEARLPECLRSLGFCDEIVVVDGGSSDRTREIARAAGAKVVDNPWPGFAAQRNVALDEARGTWALEVDADERVTRELAAEIAAFLASPPAGVRMAALPMREVFLRRPLGPSTRYPRYRHRLFRRDAFRHDESRTVHEGLWPDGPTAMLEGELCHLLAGSWGEALRDAAAYARLEAGQRSRPSLREALAGILVRPPLKLAYRLLLYGGWRDGWRGVARIGLECAADALSTALRVTGPAAGERSATGGLGQEPPHLGPIRIVGVACGRRGAERTTRWLEEAARQGADVALIAPSSPPARGVRRRSLEGLGPGPLARALDAEEQARPIDCLLPAGTRERMLLRLLPRALRGATAPLETDRNPAEALESVHRLTRLPETT